MTVLMTFVGVIVFLISLFTTPFTKAFKRLVLFALVGAFIDIFLISLGMTVSVIALT